jgi:hypothetical protein
MPIDERAAVPEYEAPEVVTYSEEELLESLVVNCGEFSF